MPNYNDPKIPVAFGAELPNFKSMVVKGKAREILHKTLSTYLQLALSKTAQLQNLVTFAWTILTAEEKQRFVNTLTLIAKNSNPQCEDVKGVTKLVAENVDLMSNTMRELGKICSDRIPNFDPEKLIQYSLH